MIAIGAYEISVGAYPRAAVVLALGLLLVGFLPDAVIRPRLARTAAGLPSCLYFVGFVGGLLSLAPVGIIAGPLVLALLVESLSLLAQEDGPGEPPGDVAEPDSSAPGAQKGSNVPTDPSPDSSPK